MLENTNTEEIPSHDSGIKSLLANVVEKIDDMYGMGKPYIGLTTGLKDFDEFSGGLHPANLIVIAGRPSMGKTTLAMNIMEHVALNCRKPVLFFSLESEPEVLVLRFLSALGWFDAHALRTGRFSEEEWPRLTSSIHLLSEAPIFIENVLEESIDTICAKARTISETCDDMGLVVVDYIQLLCRSGPSPENRTAELSAIIRKLKILAKELNVPVIAISQLNRGVEQRADKRPVMYDLRDCGSIEDDADMVCFIYRDEYYNEDSFDSGIAELIVAKHRNGPIGKVKVAYRAKYNRFNDLVFSLDETGLT